MQYRTLGLPPFFWQPVFRCAYAAQCPSGGHSAPGTAKEKARHAVQTRAEQAGRPVTGLPACPVRLSLRICTQTSVAIILFHRFTGLPGISMPYHLPFLCQFLTGHTRTRLSYHPAARKSRQNLSVLQTIFDACQTPPPQAARLQSKSKSDTIKLAAMGAVQSVSGSVSPRVKGSFLP